MRPCDPVLFYSQGPDFIGCAWACKFLSRTSLESKRYWHTDVPCRLFFGYGIETLWSLTEERGDKRRQREVLSEGGFPKEAKKGLLARALR